MELDFGQLKFSWFDLVSPFSSWFVQVSSDPTEPPFEAATEASLKEKYAHLTVLALLLVTGSIITALLKIVASILTPYDYELDMTNKKFCKQLAEIDNSLRLRHDRADPMSNGSHPPSADTESPSGLHKNSNQNLRALTNRKAQLGFPNASGTGSGLNDAPPMLGGAHHVYPNGWIPVMESFKVPAGTVKRAIIFGRDLIVTRSLDGEQVSVLDAYCPHMGVHLGVGGRVVEVDSESCIECPFHKWTYRASDGRCVLIPYQRAPSANVEPATKSCSSIPKQAKLKTWHCDEVDNFIYVWHHIDDHPPGWYLESSEQLSAPKNWQLIGRSCHLTNLELRDMHENGADMNHFEGIHNDLFIFGGQITDIRPLNNLQRYTRHHWLPEWKPIMREDGRMSHMAEMTLQSWITLFGLRLFDITVRATQVGPARVNLFYDSEWYGSGLLIMNSIPLGGRRTKYVQHVYTKRSLFQCLMAKWVLYGEIRMLERDFFIWNHKKNIKNPILVSEDKTIRQLRMWYSQFYKRKRVIKLQDSTTNDILNNIDNNNNAQGAATSCELHPGGLDF